MYPLWNGYTIDVPPNGLEPLPNFGRFTGALAQAAGRPIVNPHLDVWVKSVPRAQHLPTKDLGSTGPLWCQTITMYNVKVMVLFFSRNFTIFPQNDIFPILVFHIRVNVKMNDLSLYACIETYITHIYMIHTDYVCIYMCVYHTCVYHIYLCISFICTESRFVSLLDTEPKLIGILYLLWWTMHYYSFLLMKVFFTMSICGCG